MIDQDKLDIIGSKFYTLKSVHEMAWILMEVEVERRYSQ